MNKTKILITGVAGFLGSHLAEKLHNLKHTSDKMEKLIDRLQSRYDVVLIDTPPMIAVTDALVLSKIVDNFILVCRSDVTQKGALDRSIKSLKQVGGKFDGTVLNAISEGNNYGSGYYYNYYQYYYNEDAK